MNSRFIIALACLVVSILFPSLGLADSAVKIVNGGIQFPQDGSTQYKSATLPGCSNGGVLVYNSGNWYCGTVMPASNGIVTCVGSICSVSACMQGFADCDLVASNGCESSITTTQSCGGCGASFKCPASTACQTSSCTNGACALVNSPAGASCPGGVCDGQGVCNDGCNISGTHYLNGASNPANACQFCNPTNPTGWSNRSDGLPCNDGNACTLNDACQAGTCVGGAAVVCPAPAQCQFAGVCLPDSGACSYLNRPSTFHCDNGGTKPGTCVAGDCI